MPALRIAVLGGGPAGLTIARLLKRRRPAWEVCLHERLTPQSSFGYGVGLGYSALAALQDADPEMRHAIEGISRTVETWTIERDGERVSAANSHGLAVSRAELLETLQSAAAASGVDVRLGSEATHEDVAGTDVVVVAEGAGSRTRESLSAEFGARVTRGELAYLWCGAAIARPEMTLSIARDERGPLVAHVMPYAAAASTFQVDALLPTIQGVEGDGRSQLDRLEGHYRHLLGETRLVAKKLDWSTFPTVTCESWSHGNLVLAGDAAHTQHYTVGSGTGLAVEDAVALADALVGSDSIPDAFASYEAARRPRVERIQARAARSESWWSTLKLRIDLPLRQLLVSYLTRTRAVSLDLLAENNATLLDSTAGITVSRLRDGELADAIIDRFTLRSESAATLEVAPEISQPTIAIAVGKARQLGGLVRLTGPADVGAVLSRLDLAEHLRSEVGVKTIVSGPRAARADLALGALSGRTDGVEVDG